MFIKSQISNLNILTKIPIYILIRWGKIGREREREGEGGEERREERANIQNKEMLRDQLFQIFQLNISFNIVNRTNGQKDSLKKDT